MENEMEKLTDGLTAYVCDTICKHLASVADEAELLAACTSCKLADYRSAIEGQYIMQMIRNWRIHMEKTIRTQKQAESIIELIKDMNDMSLESLSDLCRNCDVEVIAEDGRITGYLL